MPQAKIFLRGALAIILVLLFGVGLFNAIVDPFEMYDIVNREGFNAYKSEAIHRLRLYKAMAVRRVKPEAIVMGQSDSEIGLSMRHPGWDPRAVPRYNLALDGGTLPEMHAYLLHAQAIRPLKQIVMGLNFLQFAPVVETPSDFEPAILRTPSDLSTPFEFFTVDLPLLVNRDSLFASLRTIGSQRRQGSPPRTGLAQELAGLRVLLALPLDLAEGRPPFAPASGDMFRKNDDWYGKDGQESGPNIYRNPPNPFATLGPRAAFLQWDQAYVSYHLAGWPSGVREAREPAAYGELRAIVAFCRANHIDLRLLLPPIHAHRWEIIKALDLWPAVEDWKRKLVAILAADSAQHKDVAPIPLYDFGGYTAVTTEDLPPPGSRDEMRYYWDAGHYKESVGNWALDRVFGIASSPDPAPPDFAVTLDQASLDGALAQIRSDQASYEASHPADVAQIRDEVRRQRATAGR